MTGRGPEYDPPMAARAPTMHRLRPSWGMLTVIESPVDEEERPSGLIVPVGADASDPASIVYRGVVLHCSDRTEYGIPVSDYEAEVLPPGTVVYFTAAYRILDVLIVRRRDLIAYMTDDD